MRIREPFISIVVRLAIAFILLITIFYYFDPINALKNEADTINFILLGLYAPFFFTILTIVICSILALPFWFSSKLKSWWCANLFLQILILLLGVALLFISMNGYFKVTRHKPINGDIISISLTNEFISLPGWFLVALSILIIDISRISNNLYKRIIKGADWTQSPDR
jgi:hypothetical protein